MKLNVGKSKINYEIMGKGRPIIFFSGFTNDMTAMIKYMEPILEKKDNWKRIYVDHLGVGDTEIGDDIQSVDDVLKTMLGFVDELMGEEKYVLGGYSFGGYLSRYILNNRFDKVDGLLLLTPLIIKEMEICDVDRKIEVVKNVDSSIQQNIDALIQTDLYGAMAKTNNEFLNKLFAVNNLTKVSLDDFTGTYNKPTLIITGRQDDTVGYKDAYRILDKYSRVTYICMDKCGHAAQIEQNDLFNYLVSEWIYRVEEEIMR
ncbi:alpha/beta hydrolase [Sedimentibacter sp. zth1]|uniref:alpha/beta fold hydrolase n=1 Tax=Sedimentibacter sp. zth1 TaxID=2816908 RepID=UPI001A92DC95|nr:alpha/beta hydrolase [Sedimentibacter sp. zth1]QSX04645.1 alpha/beta hydrolase [Sedimentibacter sp. zth1]